MKKLSSVLLVDDDTTGNFLNELLFRRLEVTDHITVVENGQQALDLLAHLPDAEQPALLLLDVNMPGLTGMQFLEAYQQLPIAERAQTVIVMLTTSMDAQDLGRLDELRVAGLASKPLTKEKINTLLQVHFQRQLPSIGR